MIQKCPEGICALDAVWPDSLLCPASIIDCMVGLNGGDHPQPRIAGKILGGQVLRMLDPPTAVALSIGFLDLLKHIESHGDGAIADGMYAELQSRRIRALQPLPHGRRRMHLVTQQS